MNVSLQSFTLPLASPLETATGTIERREGTVLVLSDGEHAGVGEATPLPGWTEALADCRSALDAARDPLREGDFAAATAAVEGRAAAPPPGARARDDLAARRAGRPLYRHLGAEGERRTVPVNATLGDAPRPQTAAAAREAVDDGFETLKVKVGARDVVDDAGRLRAVRDAVGDGVVLRADANAAWDRPTARQAVRSFTVPDVAYVEQPLAPAELSGHATLRGGEVGVAVDETLAAVPLSEVLRAGAADVVVLKPMVLGGVDRAREAALAARRSGVRPVVSTTVDGVVARTAAVHLAASLTDLPASGLATADRLAADIAEDPAPVRDGAARVPQSPGTGVAVAEVRSG
jgi:o-succinylbenzoate synthase